MSQQHPAIRMEFDRVVAEYAAPVQAAGLPVAVIEAHMRESATPDQLRRALTRALQSTLPRNLPGSIRADATTAPAAEFASTATKVKEAVFEVASRGPELRAVTTRDRSGRECTEFYGQKKSWMAQYTAPAMLMKRIGDATY
ncbi:hypothetical protein [Paraburkholderia xenovorans]|uniref:hypothetical protein n=1 Tax=Paraburkholderia xenovorans TaxID=36873 RepID=UPI0015C527C7|nr:hypothetical protein [Paraburkholderia xenovorans]NPT36327.1 hypothetical protein [Paraburkholderia xenovorans]